MTQAIILAGGKGTRLAAAAPGVPKPLVAVAGVPVVVRQIELLAHYGIRDILLTTGHLAGELVEHLGDGSRWGVSLRYFEEASPLGTAGGVAALADHIVGDALVLYGDVLINMDLHRLVDYHRERDVAATVVVHPNDHPFDSDLVEVDREDGIVAFHPYPRNAPSLDLPNLVSAGLYVIAHRVLDAVERNRAQDFVRDVFPRLLSGGERLAAYRTTEYLKDMGTPDRLAHVEADIESGRVAAMHRDVTRPTAFLDRDGVLNEEIDGVLVPDALRLLPGVAPAIRRLNQAGWLVAAVTNQPAVAKGLLDEDTLLRIHVRLQALLGAEGAWLDWLAYCPHHPERGFPGERLELKIACGCRKPEPGLLEQTARAVPVDLSRSVLVGDSWRDIAAARRFGIAAVGVRSGHALRQTPPTRFAESSVPDAVADDLSQAVSLLLDVDPEVERVGNCILDRMSQGDQVLLVQVGGLSRSGKSWACFRLSRLLHDAGIEVLSVRLDDWLLPAQLRKPDSTVAERYRLDELDGAIASLMRGDVVQAPGYDPQTRDSGPTVHYGPAPGAGVVLVEGVPALLLATHGGAIRVYVEAEGETARLERVKSLYRQRGHGDDAIDEILSSRTEETVTISATRTSADLVITPFGHPKSRGPT